MLRFRFTNQVLHVSIPPIPSFLHALIRLPLFSIPVKRFVSDTQTYTVLLAGAPCQVLFYDRFIYGTLRVLIGAMLILSAHSFLIPDLPTDLHHKNIYFFGIHMDYLTFVIQRAYTIQYSNYRAIFTNIISYLVVGRLYPIVGRL